MELTHAASDRATRGCVLLAALLPLVGCGGSGGGGASGAGGPPPLTGEFQAVSLKAEVPPTCTSLWGPATSDGLTLSLALATNVDGTVGVPVPDAFGLLVSSDGAFTLRKAADFVWSGAVGADRSVVLAGDVRAGDAPGLLTLVRRTYPTVLADLAGSYRVAFFTLLTGGRCTVGTATFDGAGAGLLLAGAVVHSNGSVSATGSSSPMTYAMSLDGEVDLTSSPGTVFHGGLHVSRDLLVLGGSTLNGPAPGIFAFVKYATATGPDVFSGAYTMVGLAYGYGTPAMRSFAGEIVADGFGTATVQGTINIEGAVAPTPATSYTYAVSGNGALSVVTPEGTFVGGICQSGDFALLGGPTTVLADPALYLLVRR